MEKGYKRFIVNNLGHFSLFRKAQGGQENAVLVAGPWLYVFNAWARDFISRLGAAFCVSPLENNRQNLERTFPREEKSAPGGRQVFITIYNRPSLFRIRSDLCGAYDFTNFSGNRGENFLLTPGPEGSLVYPQEPFSIVDKTGFLMGKGFSRFILDFSSGPLKKADYRNIMEAAKLAAHIPGTSRFNWKDGFFREPSA